MLKGYRKDEMTVRGLCEKARAAYNDIDPCVIYSNNDGLYVLDGPGMITGPMNKEELEETLVSLYWAFTAEYEK